MGNDAANSEQKPRRQRCQGTVEKVIKPPHPSIPEKAQIAVHGADDLYREIRVENVLKDDEGKKVALKEGAGVEVKIEADPEATTARP